jgi:membrane-associated phospholipid phosphatase
MKSRTHLSKSSNWPLLIVTGFLVVLTVALGFLADGWVALQLTEWRSPDVQRIAAGVSRLSDWPWLVSALVLSTWVFHCARRARPRQICAAMTLAAVLSGVTATTVRSLSGRTRPGSPAQQGFYGPIHEGRLLIGKHEYNSFPSGHTATAAGAGAALLFVGWRLGSLGMLFAGLVAWSRLILNCHHFSDVLVAILLGIAGAGVAWRILRAGENVRAQPVQALGSDRSVASFDSPPASAPSR